nr:hypothetical protein 15 [bacterium]
MSELINPQDTQALWRKQEKIREMFAPDLTEPEFKIFVGLGMSLGANPFAREIWAVKYGNRPAQIFLGRDFYRKKAQEQPDYKGHQVDVIYTNDSFQVSNGEINHSYQLGDRGKMVGAYCTVFREGKQPYFQVVKIQEYFQGGNKNKNLWDTKPETMIKKVAEAQALRGAYQGVFAGTYDESEEWTVHTESEKKDLPKLEGNKLEVARNQINKGEITLERLEELYDLSEEDKQFLMEVQEDA